ncbi:3-deoxy-7-phosphoheptulonate synthase [Litorivicinus sp.]|jgi:3-deoxy-7-phosphoheptulonate synthase|nr:3-deoxy-7-phosphoheptulonate synthase [Litorivicinus sp.]MBL6810032.1 3-deoxy-7-phosphoheptulonate synthase [Litorivicinus sp.]MDB2401894.1 3-deoxy-7-phosphoheptulonate synthase [Litorivicinaceae bacterium]MDC3278864.1 3-deoxy-7-phosphoheptulonate synthase [Litorivicinus sp.]
MRLSDLNIDDYQVVITPTELKKELPLPESVRDLVANSRQTVKDILDGKDDRLFAVVGPCSIHDTELALEYGKRLKALADEVSEQVFIIMRVYFEKPRTTVGWKGLINDPHLNGSFEIEDGLRKARKLLIDLSEIGLPLATEALDPISPQYLQDTITWTAIGARTTESQTHREMSSGLSSPVGFKNGTDGSLDVAVNAMKSVVSGHAFLGINPQGQVAITKTKGNQYGHVVLRGGGGKPNYDSVSIALCEQALEKAKLPTNIVVDCSHANSNKDHNVQPLVLDDIAHQIKDGNRSICGVMIESNINEGNQSIPDDLSQLKYGVSVTDACISWESTVKSLNKMASTLTGHLTGRRG